MVASASSASSASSSSPRRKRPSRPRTQLKVLPPVEVVEDRENQPVTAFPLEHHLRQGINEFYHLAREQHRAFRQGAYAEAEQLAFSLLQSVPVFYQNVARLLQLIEKPRRPPSPPAASSDSSDSSESHL